ncbi:GerAB/ArcD/ProY family transporter [Polycladomyces subterraneus]|uniref:Spore germination protein n=1 Tax=Polycladomyces subterraneus TaxID=1016997 RepID=A0ABT8IK33_9BACL|nr:GerAB/ArcD/ProY family transporter [Polycladomyces subterraneus]MDN4593148.1 spore germination protein [Polycladomyces subterraneus]
MIKESSRITQGQLFYYIIQAQVGVGILSMPHDVQAVAKGGAWISVLIGGVVVQLAILIIWALCKRFPNLTMYEYLPKIFGKWIGGFFNFAYIFFFILMATLVLILFESLINKWIFPLTPRWATLSLIVITSVYLVIESLRKITRFYVFATVLIVLIVLIALNAFTIVNFTYMLPITEAGWGKIFLGSNKVIISLLGFELLLVVYPFVEGKADGKLKAASAGNALTTLLYSFMVFIALIVFSPMELAMIPEPIPYMLKAFSYRVVERVDLLFLSIWMVIVATSYMNYLFLASSGFGHYFHRGNHRRAVYYTAIISFILALIPEGPDECRLFTQIVSWASYAFVYGLPLLFLLISLVFRKQEKGNTA